jgi:hypothetical protein
MDRVLTVFCLLLMASGFALADEQVSVSVGVTATIQSSGGPTVTAIQNLGLGSLSATGTAGSSDVCAQNSGATVTCTGNATYTVGSGSQLGQVLIQNEGSGSVNISSIVASSSTAVANSQTFTMNISNVGTSCVGTIGVSGSCTQNLAGSLAMPNNYNFSTNPPGAMAFSNSTVTVTYSG